MADVAPGRIVGNYRFAQAALRGSRYVGMSDGRRLILPMGSIGVSDCASWEYIRLSADYLFDTFGSNSQRHPAIADKELMGLALGSVAGAAAQPQEVLLIGVGNMNSVCWVGTGTARSRFSRKSMSNFCYGLWGTR